MLPTTPRSIAALVPAARRAIAGAVYRTPLERAAWLSEISGADVSLKLECYQPTGSFKVRGAFAAISQLPKDESERGVVTASAGNHGLGVAYAASRLGARATVVVPDDVSEAKVSALRRFPIELLRGGPSYDTAECAAIDLARKTGRAFVSPYNDPWVVAGQGTIGVELLEDEPRLDVVLVPIGGGGLISGVGSWLKRVNPEVRVVGVQPAASPSMEQALKAGKLVEIEVEPTLADGLAGNIEMGSITFDLAREVVDDLVLVGEDEISSTIGACFHQLHLALEGSAVVTIAALLGDRVEGISGMKVAAMVTGRNIARERLVQILGAPG